MNFIQIKTLKNLITAAMLLVISSCLTWAGITEMTARSTSILQLLMLENYEWSHAQAVFVRFSYQVDIWWWELLSAVNMSWIFVTTLVVAALTRFISFRLGAIAAVVVLLSTIHLGAPIKLTEMAWELTTGSPRTFEVSQAMGESQSTQSTKQAPEAAAEQTEATTWWNADGMSKLHILALGASLAAEGNKLLHSFLIVLIVFATTMTVVSTYRKPRE
jgi:hypothetical protein